jgi:hypothetical protein
MLKIKDMKGQRRASWYDSPDGHPGKGTMSAEDQLTQAVENAITVGASTLVCELHRRAPSMISEHRKVRKGFESRLAHRRKAAFALFEMILVSAVESVQEFDQKNRGEAKANNDRTFEALLLLSIRACRTASEILALLRAGHADGALARWRTMYELAVIAFFVSRNKQDTAERYLMHRFIEKYEAAKEYQLHCFKLNQEPLSAEEVGRLTAFRDCLLDKYGQRFSGRYGWAHAAVLEADSQFREKDQVTFGNLERSCDLKHFRPYYRFACQKVHAGAQGDYESLGVIDGSDVQLIGASNTGFADPGQNTCISLVQVVTSLLAHKPDPLNLIAAQALRLLSGEACGEFLRIQKKIEEEAAEEGQT